jgi:hypothetical protein
MISCLSWHFANGPVPRHVKILYPFMCRDTPELSPSNPAHIDDAAIALPDGNFEPGISS